MNNPLFVGAPDNHAIRQLRAAVIRRDAKSRRLTRAIFWLAIVMLTTATASLEVVRATVLP